MLSCRKSRFSAYTFAMAVKKTTKKPMSDQHKAALAKGREEGRKVREYLEALEANKPRRGRRQTPESIRKRLDVIEQKITDADPLNRVQLIQERMDLQKKLDANNNSVDLPKLEKAFISSARGYSERKGISYAAWRELGVPPNVLQQAGISRAAS